MDIKSLVDDIRIGCSDVASVEPKLGSKSRVEVERIGEKGVEKFNGYGGASIELDGRMIADTDERLHDLAANESDFQTEVCPLVSS